MRIDRVEAITLCYEYPGDRRFTYTGGVCTHRATTLVLVHADSGQIGIGSVYSHPGLVHLIVDTQLDPLLRGAEAGDVEGLWDRMYGLTRWYGRKGAAISTLGGVDTALWDLRGKAQGQPVWRILGGDSPTCPAYASGLLWNDLDSLAAEAARHIDSGFRRVKMRLARSEAYDREAVLAVRAAIGSSCDVIVDASMRYHLDLARRMGDFLSGQGVFWYEEPFAPEDIDSYCALRGTVGIPLAGGENEFGLQGFRELIRAGAVDIVQPDASRCGGISEVWRVGQLAAQHDLRVATHSWSDAVAVVANAHAVAAMPNGITVEVDRTGTPLVDDLLAGGLRVSEGSLDLGDEPGLGIDLNTEVVERLRLADPLTMPAGLYSDMAFGEGHFIQPAPYQEES